MSRHLLIRCDAPGCANQTETNAPDNAPVGIEVPAGWLTLRQDGRGDKHYCGETCLRLAVAPPTAPAVVDVTSILARQNPLLPPETFLSSGLQLAPRKSPHPKGR